MGQQLNVLVTGASGFIGHNVVKYLEQEGHSCFGIDSFTNYNFIPKDELEFLKRERKRKVRCNTHNVDIRNRKGISDMMLAFHPKMVVHLASFPRQRVVLQNPVVGSEVMITGLINLLEECKQNRVKKFVYVSSSMVYGDFETDFVKETAPCSPQGQYAIMKYMGEKIVEDYARRTGMDYVIVRPSAVYGELDVDDRVVSKFMIGALQGKTLRVQGAQEVLDFTHVDDTAKGIALAALESKANGNVYNITRSNPVALTLEGAAQLCIDIVGRGSYEIKDRDLNFPKRGRLSIESAQTDLGYFPTVDVEQGFERYHAWLVGSKFWQHKLSLLPA